MQNVSLGNKQESTRTNLTHHRTQTVIKKNKKKDVTKDFFFISNEKDTKCIKMLFTVFFSSFTLDQVDLTCLSFNSF